MADLEPMPISTLPKADQLETDDQMIAYREETGKAYRSNVGALGEAAQGAISDAFSETKTYNAGDYCIYNDTLYKFTDDKDIGEWDDSVVEKTTATAEIQSNTDLIDSLPMIQTGGVSVPSTSAGGTSEVDITFDTPFPDVPRIFISIGSVSATGYGNTIFTFTNRTATGFTLRFINGSSGSLSPTANWLAIYR